MVGFASLYPPYASCFSPAPIAAPMPVAVGIARPVTPPIRPRPVIRSRRDDVRRRDVGVVFDGRRRRIPIRGGRRRRWIVALLCRRRRVIAGRRSRVCQETLGGLNDLDLAVGIELGPTPLTRLGRSGDESVRCAASRAVVLSERIQQTIEKGGVKLGANALTHADASVKRHYRESATILGFDAAADLLGSASSPAVTVVREDRTARPYISKVHS
jgi:hypothetical protein